MSAWMRAGAGMLVAAALGALLAYRSGLPRTDDSGAVRQPAWRLPQGGTPALKAPDLVWAERAPWGAPPPPPVPPPPPPPPPPMPVGVIASGPRHFQALFVVPGQPLEHRVRAGGRLPDGGRVLSVTRFRVVWRDGKGERHEQELLADPLPLTGAGGPTAPQARAATATRRRNNR